jgi:hypothetical protein
VRLSCQPVISVLINLPSYYNTVGMHTTGEPDVAARYDTLVNTELSSEDFSTNLTVDSKYDDDLRRIMESLFCSS